LALAPRQYKITGQNPRSARAKQPFITVNCAAIPPSLIASELFAIRQIFHARDFRRSQYFQPGDEISTSTELQQY